MDPLHNKSYKVEELNEKLIKVTLIVDKHEDKHPLVKYLRRYRDKRLRDNNKNYIRKTFTRDILFFWFFVFVALC